MYIFMENKTNNKGICYITGASKVKNIFINKKENDYIIAADGGYSTLIKANIIPDIIIGDFDSLKKKPDDGKILSLPKEKDDTDMLFAVKHAMSLGYGTIVLLGGMGGRLDHTIANIQTLSFIKDNGARGFLIDEKNIITVVKNETINFKETETGTISVFCLGDRAEGISLRGLKYPLDNAVLTCSNPLGVSNEFTGIHSSVTVCDGRLVIIWNKSEQDFYTKPLIKNQ